MTTAHEELDRCMVHFHHEEYRLAIPCCHHALDLAYAERDMDVAMGALFMLSDVHGNLGEGQKQAEFATRLLAVARREGIQEYIMIAGLRLVDALEESQSHAQWSDIRELLLSGLQVAESIGSEFWQVYHLTVLGEVAFQADALQDSFEWLQDALNRIPPSLDAADVAFFQYRIYRALCIWFGRQGNPREEMRSAEMSLEAAKRCGWSTCIARAEERLGRCMRRQGRREDAECHLDLAVAAYRSFLSRNSDNLSALNSLAFLLTEQHRTEEGVHAWERCLTLSPDNPTALNNLAYLLFEQQRVEEAIHSWERSFTIRAGHTDTLAGYALGLWKTGRRYQAIRAFRAVLASEPEYADLEWLPGPPA